MRNQELTPSPGTSGLGFLLSGFRSLASAMCRRRHEVREQKHLVYLSKRRRNGRNLDEVAVQRAEQDVPEDRGIRNQAGTPSEKKPMETDRCDYEIAKCINTIWRYL